MQHSWTFDRCRPIGLGVCWDRRRERCEHPFEADGDRRRGPRRPRASPSPRPRPPPAVVAGTYTPTASGGASGNPVTFSIDASATWKLHHLGCDRHLRRRRDLRHRRQPGRQRQLRGRNPGPAVLRRSSAPRASPSPRPRPARAVVGGTYPVTATGGASGNPVTFSIDPSAHGGCTISGATVTFVAVGTCVIDANQAGNASYEAAAQVQQSFAVLGTQSITFTSTPPRHRGRRRHLHPDGERRGEWQPGHLLDRRLGAWKLRHLGCDRHLRRRRDLRHRRQPGRQRQLRGRNPGPAVLRSGLGAQSITFTSTPPNPAVVGGTYTPTASGGASRQPGHLLDRPARRMEAAPSRVPTVTFVAVGTCVIDANQAGNASLRGRSPGPAVLRGQRVRLDAPTLERPSDLAARHRLRQRVPPHRPLLCSVWCGDGPCGDNSSIFASVLPANTTYWFAPGTHTLGNR